MELSAGQVSRPNCERGFTLNTPIRIYVLYGGKSAEHDISLKTARNVLAHLNRTDYAVYPVYITRDGCWQLKEQLNSAALSDEADLLALPDWRSPLPPAAADNVSQQLPQDGDSRQRQAEEGSGSPAASIAHVLLHMAESNDKVVFPLLHGTYGEDGTLQGLLEMIDAPYVGNGVAASAISINKLLQKRLLLHSGVQQAAFVGVNRNEWEANEAEVRRQVERVSGYPCYVKPASLGSSIGISYCQEPQQLGEAIEQALRYDEQAIVEQEIRGREVQVAVLGNERVKSSVCGEFEREEGFFDYRGKYGSGRLVQRIPAELPADTERRMRAQARDIFRRLGGAGLMRVDFFVTAEQEIYLNEVNTLPGFTAISMYPALWEKTDGCGYSELLERLIQLAQERHAAKGRIRYGRDEG